MLKVILLLCTSASLLHFSQCRTKFWKYTNNIMDPINWEGGKKSKINEGVIFPRDLGAVASILELHATELVLPEEGEIEIRDHGFIEISPNASSYGFRIKQLEPHRWLNPNNWFTELQNVAVPDVEKVPCDYDDVVFQKNGTVAVLLPESSLSVNSIQLEGVGLNDPQWLNYLETDYGSEQFFMSDYGETKISIESNSCEKSDVCSCHSSEAITTWVCMEIKQKDPPCFNPIKPIGHCNSICGGVVKFEVNPGFRLDEVVQKNPNYDRVDTYASKVLENGKPVVQIIFAEKKEYREISTKAAAEFYDSVLHDSAHLKIKNARLEMSGIYLPQGSVAATTFSIIFGTLMAVTILFGLLYFMFLGPLKDYNLRTPFGEVLGGNFSPLLFAKFENREEGSLSVAPSMVNLASSFDNPMYGSGEPSTGSEAVDVLVMGDTSTNTSSGTEHENPLYREKHEKGEIKEDIIIEDIKED